MGEGDHCGAMVEWGRAEGATKSGALSGRTLSARFAATFPIEGKDEYNCAFYPVIPAKAGTQFIRLGPAPESGCP